MSHLSNRLHTICCRASSLCLQNQPILHWRNGLTNFQQARQLRAFREKTVRLMYWRGKSFDRIDIKERRSDFTDWNFRSEIFAFSRRLQENISEDTLREVFSPPSYIEKMKQTQEDYNLPSVNIKSNEELVKRGMQLLDECIKPYLRYTFRKMPEDGIIDITEYLKSTDVLADIANLLGCKEIVLSSEYPPPPQAMADTILAFVGGIERDLGLDRVQRFIVDIILSYLEDKHILDDIWIIPNPREVLNLILKNNNLPLYEPRIMFETGIKTLEPCHVVGLYVDQNYIGSSAGETLDIAEDCAALNALERMFDLTFSRAPYVYGEASEGIDYKLFREENDYIRDWKLC